MRSRSVRGGAPGALGIAGSLWVAGFAFMGQAWAAAPAAVPMRMGGANDTTVTRIEAGTWVDHDRRAIPKPPDEEPSFSGRRVREALLDPVTHALDVPDKLLRVLRALGVHTDHEAVNVNAFDEVPNSSWFTNRNHLRAVPVAELRDGPDSTALPLKPWVIKHVKHGGWSTGFQIKDAEGRKWLVKLDPRAYPQLSSGADMVSRTLFHAAGYNVPHNEPVRFRRADLRIDEDLLAGKGGEQVTEVELDTLLTRGAVLADSSYSATASLFLPGHVLGAPNMRGRRPGDLNDWFTHPNRRELRGLFVLCSWLDDWDTEDHQFLDVFIPTRDSLGHVEHYILDAGASLGAAADGPKLSWEGYEHAVDFGWTARRLVTLGFVTEPWRRARQNTGIPSVGRLESDVYTPEHFATLVTHPAFRKMTDRDGYWGTKLVASFSDAQIAAAVDAARYDDPAAREFLVRNLIQRRDKIARHWFGRIAPLDFFVVKDGSLWFHDLAVDIGLAPPRDYDVEVIGGHATKRSHVRLDRAELSLPTVETGAQRLTLELSVAGSRAKPAQVELTRRDSQWFVTRVRHG